MVTSQNSGCESFFNVDSVCTLVDILHSRALYQPDKKAFTFLLDGETEESSLTYRELDLQARAIATRLQNLGASGDRALLIYPPGLEFIAAFFGCLYAGVVAVPAYPSRRNQSLSRLQSIVADAGATIALTTKTVLSNVERQFTQSPTLQALHWLATDNIASHLAPAWHKPPISSDTLAFLQYTSGSTGTPKGVIVSHGNLLHNEQMIQQAMQHTEKTIFVGWLPLFHDMGLIGNVLQPLYLGIPCILMSPVAFLQRPLRWLQAISRYKATTSGGPNFAYELCVSKITNEQRETLDLSSWDVAFNGAEPVRAETLERFATAFEPYGFRREAFYPCYGMAETTLLVSGGLKAALPVLTTVQGDALEQNQVVSASGENDEVRTLVGCGQTLLEQQIVIAHPDTLTRCQPPFVGEIWVSGNSVAQGYWNRPEETQTTFQAYLADTGEGPFLRTGDLGFLQEGELFVTGRLKDLIIIRGRNHYPQDIELTVEQSHPVLQQGCTAAFSVEVNGQERLVVACEVERTSRRNLDVDEVVGAIRKAVLEQHDLEVYGVLLLKTGTVPKTSSGKIQRHGCKAGFLAESLSVVGSSILSHTDDLIEGNTITQETLPPTTQTQRQLLLELDLRNQLAPLLGISPSQLNPQQPFNTLGLDSLKAVQIKNQIEANFGLVLPIETFLDDINITQLATQILSGATSPAPTPSSISAPVQTATQLLREKVNESKYFFPLSQGQQALWFLYKLVPHSWAYNTLFTARIQSPVDIPALRRTFQSLISRHLSLQTTYTERDGKPFQQIHEDVEVQFEEIDASTWNWDELKEQVTQEARRPFNLEQGSVMRVSLFTRSPKDHILMLAIHHIASDFWSLLILMDELRVLYSAEKTGTQASLPAQNLSYVDYVHWQNQMLAGSAGEQLWAYWREQLAGELPVINLPTDRPRSPVQTYQGASHSFRLTEELAQRLKGLAQAEKATLYMTLLAAFQVLLYRYTGQEDILVGSPTFGRTQREFAEIVGYLVNPVVLRANLSGNPTFQAFLGQVRQTVLGAIAHQDYPFPLLVERLQPNRDPTRSPIFQVSFALQKPQQFEEVVELFAPSETASQVNWGELKLEPFEIPQQEGQFDLTLEMIEARESLFGVFKYNTDLFEADTITRMSGHFHTLLEAIVTNPQQRVSQFPLLSEAERHQLLVEWNDTLVDYPKDVCIHQLFEAQVEQTPNAVAVVFEDEQLTYGELNSRANQLAHHLRSLNVGPDSLVGICVERSLEMVVGLLGILKAGGAYVPLDPVYPKERLAFMLQDAQVSVLLTQEPLVAELPDHGARVICLDTDWGTIAQESAATPVSLVGSQNLAYALYTSGSTGRPKGVLIIHQALVNYALAVMKDFGLQSSDRILLLASISFDVFLEELLPTWLSGATVVLRGERSLVSGADLQQLIEKHRLTAFELTTAHWHEWVYELSLSKQRPPNSLRFVIMGGEKVLPERFATWQKFGIPLIHVYGLTETTITSTIYKPPLRVEDQEVWSKLPIGRPVANTQIYLLDTNLQPVPIGVPGELHIGGAGLARGYLNRPELTEEKFIPNPFSDEPGARLYKTGDKARYLPDGNIEFLGRIDHQVKLRGFRIELGEIEATLTQHPQVRQTLVMDREDVLGDKRLVAYVVSGQEQPPSVSEVRHFLKQKLPDYMVPAAFVLLDVLPLTPNGKIDRRALPAPDTTRPFEEGAYVAPQSPVEEMVAGIWADVLAVKEVSIHDNFFDLGGHSLLVTQLISRLRDTFNVEFPLRGLFESPTVASLSERLEALRRTEQGLVAPPLLPVEREGELLLSFAQARLWFLEQLEPGSYAYNMPAAVRLTGSLNVAALKQSLQEIVQRHEALRTTFRMVSGEPLQLIAPVKALTLPLVDLCQLPEAQQEAQVERLATSEAQQPFDLAIGPLLRAKLLHLGEAEHVLLLTMHHIVSDGWSIGVLIRELAALYEAFSSGKPSPLPQLPIQYADFAHWQRQWLQGEVLAAQLSYWQQQLAGAQTVLELPTDRRRPAVQTYGGATQFLALPAPLSQKLKSLSQRSGVTLFMTLLAAFQTLLYRYTGQEDICIGSPIANRNRSETEDLIGFFVNTLVLRTDMSENPSFQELLGRVREVALGAYAHQDLPFEQLVEALQPERNLSHQPLFQVMFALENAPMSALELPSLTLSSLNIDSSTAKFDLTLSMEDTEQGLVGSLEYNTDLFDVATISRMLEHFQTLLEGIVANPEQPLSDLPLLTQPERQQLLVEWNDTLVAYPKDVCIHQLFEAQVERTPNAVAVMFEDQQLTYGELNRRANQVAHHLRSLGVDPDDRVGICVERSLEMIAGLLGILKAGGAYVPLDPAYPKDRLAYMLNDSQMPILVTTEKLSAALPEHQARVVYLDKDWGINSADSDVAPVSSVTDENLAYVIYTSGSTGKPKGVGIAHRSLVNAYLAWEDAYQLRSLCKSHLQMASFSFDVFSGDLVRALCSGAKLVICPREWLLEPENLYELMLQEKIDCAEFVPVVLRNLIQYLERTKQDLSFMRLLIAGSDSWHIKEYQQFQHFCDPQTRLINSYGATEATIDSSYFESAALSFSIDGLVPIGRPFANTQIYILDSHLQPVPIGVAGELHIGGAGLARSYLNQLELTEQKFIPNPFSNKSGDRLYKTGDLGRYRSDGTIEFLGRVDNQVKIRGFRIEVGEIEAELSQHPAVQQVAIVDREDQPGNKRLVAYFVPNQEQVPSPDELRRFLKEKLPDFMLPSAFVHLDVLPLTPNGKVNRQALPVPDPSHMGSEVTFVPPRNLTEETLASIWGDLLKLERVGIHDDFFDLGGHSLLATQVISRLRVALSVELPLRCLFESSTIAELAELVVAQQIKQVESDTLEQILAEVDELSEDKVKQLLLEYQ